MLDQKTKTTLFPQLSEESKNLCKKNQNGRRKNSKWLPESLKVIFRGEKRVGSKHFMAEKVLRIQFYVL